MYRTKNMLYIETYIDADNGVIEFVETNGSNLTDRVYSQIGSGVRS